MHNKVIKSDHRCDGARGQNGRANSKLNGFEINKKKSIILKVYKLFGYDILTKLILLQVWLIIKPKYFIYCFRFGGLSNRNILCLTCSSDLFYVCQTHIILSLTDYQMTINLGSDIFTKPILLWVWLIVKPKCFRFVIFTLSILLQIQLVIKLKYFELCQTHII